MIHDVIHAKRRYNYREGGHVYTACETFLNSPGASLENIGKRIVAKESIEPDMHTYKSLLAEYSLFVLFEALGFQREWEVGYPIHGEYLSDTGIIIPEGIGRRLGIKYEYDYESVKRIGHTEIDGLVSIRFNDREAWAVLEAKSGKLPPTLKEIHKHVTAVRTVTGKNPYYVLGIPQNSKLLGPDDYNVYRRDEFTGRGGIILIFNESAEEIGSTAKSMFDEATGAVRNKRRQRTGIA